MCTADAHVHTDASINRISMGLEKAELSRDEIHQVGLRPVSTLPACVLSYRLLLYLSFSLSLSSVPCFLNGCFVTKFLDRTTYISFYLRLRLPLKFLRGKLFPHNCKKSYRGKMVL